MKIASRHRKGLGFAIVCLTIIGSATIISPVLSPAQAESSLADKIVNDPSRGWQLFGSTASHELIQDATVQGGTAERVTITQKGTNPWDAGALTNIAKPIKQGDVLLMAFYAKAVEPPEGADTVEIIARLQEAAAPYTSIGTQETIQVGKTWKLYYAKGVAAKDYAMGDAGGALNLATGKEVIDFGPIIIINYGQGYDLSKLPGNH